ncbi:MAG: hypothetical protein K2L21_01200 [Muribaculaceae bacterium]|nr:hypothetical protein [Muribaculaceae bacterium]
MVRLLAHRVVHDGNLAGLSVVVADDSGIAVMPFEGETAETAFIDGTIIVEDGVLYHTPLLISSLPFPSGLQTARVWPQD